MPVKVSLLATDLQDYTVTFAIGADRWEYHFRGPVHIDVVTYLARRWSSAKALNFAKKRAFDSVKL